VSIAARCKNGKGIKESFGREFSLLYIVTELWPSEVKVVGNCIKKFAFLKKDP